ncbi:MAG TPA: DinB family protein [Pirellulaceae bacterium]|nr:DinB family protein [Pirellulaceae bacterium]HMO92662.1 DinB family protein [Pirellulaceae bacterium]HMP70590.1 DinB family protein [Pirellulaceae bacterium]
MSLAEILMPEFDDEIKRTRIVLAAVPQDKLDWKPAEGFHSIGWNANHLADMLSWTQVIIQQAEFDIHPPGGEPHGTPNLMDPAEILESFDRNAAESRAILAATDDNTFAEMWTMKMGGNDLFTIPKWTCIRTWVMNHSFHHRGILSVYLRMAGVELTPIYDG